MATTTGSTGQQAPPDEVDVLVVGAGISGLGLAHHLVTHRPGTTFAVLDKADAVGGTWQLFRYPGIRSDSDMPTFGYGFRPWSEPTSIAPGASIVEYLHGTVRDGGFDDRLHLGRVVESSDWDGCARRWQVVSRPATGGDRTTTTARFLFLATGYYDHEAGFTPDFDGVEDFRGTLVHPQLWPEDLDHTDKRVVVIGSGATAVTLVPAMSRTAAHVTMLQRSPGYVISMPSKDPVARVLTRLCGPKRAHALVRRKNIAQARGLYRLCRRFPRLMRRLLIAQVRLQLPRSFDVDRHFTPRYDPWDQRLCVVPDGDLFKALRSGRASVVTDHVDRFVPEGVRLTSGEVLPADVVVTATGLSMLAFGRIRLSVDGEPVDLPERTVFKSMMVSGVPNLAFAIGYSNISWTLKVDLVAEHLCRLLDHMDRHGLDAVVPTLDRPVERRTPILDLAAGYVARGVAQFPHGGDADPWSLHQSYEKDVARLRDAEVADPALDFLPTVPTGASR